MRRVRAGQIYRIGMYVQELRRDVNEKALVSGADAVRADCVSRAGRVVRTGACRDVESVIGQGGAEYAL